MRLLKGLSPINDPFSIAMFDDRRVNPIPDALFFPSRFFFRCSDRVVSLVEEVRIRQSDAMSGGAVMAASFKMKKGLLQTQEIGWDMLID